MGDSSLIFLILLHALLVGCKSTSERNEPNGFIFTCLRSFKTGADNQLQLRRFGKLDAGVLFVDVSLADGTSLAKGFFLIGEGERDLNLELYVRPIADPAKFLKNPMGKTGRIVLNSSFSDPSYTIQGSGVVFFTTWEEYMVFIQTEKPLYKEGQTVKFRVLVMDKELKPITKNETDVWVEDPNGNKLFQWKGVSLQKGIKQFEFPLADETAKSKWKIFASFKSEMNSTVFEVKEYVHPKYEVKIMSPTYVLTSVTEIPITVCAKYAYGKPVKGELRLHITEYFSRKNKPSIKYVGQIDGCLDYMISTSLFKYEYDPRPTIKAVVEEFGTGIQRNVSKYITRYHFPLKLIFSHQRQFYKPGLPYYGQLKVNHPDKTPAQGEPIEICCKFRKQMRKIYDEQIPLDLCRKYTSDGNGYINFTIAAHSGDYATIKCQAISLNYTRDILRESETLKKLNTPKATMSLNPWRSSSQSFIQLQPVDEPLTCGTTKKFKVLYTFEEDANYTFKYQILSKGQTVLTKEAEVKFSIDQDISSQFKYDDKLENTTPLEDEDISSQFKYDDKLEHTTPVEDDEYDSISWFVERIPYDPDFRTRHIGEFDIETEISPSWSPAVHFLIYYVRRDREVVADVKTFKVEKCFRNKVKFRFGDDVKQPATETSLRISASPNSFCGVKLVDKSFSLLDSGDQFSKEKIFSVLESFDIVEQMRYERRCEPSSRPFSRIKRSYMIQEGDWNSFLDPEHDGDSLAAFENVGILTISDLKLRPCDTGLPGYLNRLAFGNPRKRKPTKSAVEEQNYFPETWLFDIKITDEDGEYLSKEILPHTITEWQGNAVCINENDGLGISDQTTIRGYQDFSLSLTLPQSAVRGEIITATVSVFNYIKYSLPITISVDKLHGFHVNGDSIDGDICVEPESSTSLKIQLKAVHLNRQNITIRAQTTQSDICGNSNVWNTLTKDAITDSVLIEAEGWPAEHVGSVFFCPKDQEKGVFKQELSLAIPKDVVPDSATGFLDVTGNVLGKTLENLENLLQLPTGGGEENMIKFAPNVIVLDVLAKTNQLTKDLKFRIAKNLNTGLQRQLQYKHPDGSFSTFGIRDREGSMFLTAYVLRYFSAAAASITIDNNTLVQMQNWITSKQQTDGCFPDVGVIIHRELQGAMVKYNSQGVITAYVLTSLLYSGYQDQTVLDSALTCLQNNKDESFYATFMCAYAEALAGRTDSARERLILAKSRAITNRKVKYYDDFNATRSQDIATASYSLLTMLKLGESPSESIYIVQHLIKNMNSHGGFLSTQDTCVGLEALGEYAKLTFKDPVDITIKARGGLEKEIKVTSDEKMLVKRYKFDYIPSDIEIEATGPGCAVLQIILNYTSKSSPEKKMFNIEVVGHCTNNLCKRSEIEVTVSYVPEDKKSGMTLVEVKMISGWSPDKESLQQLLNETDLELMRYEVDSNVVVFYFSEISNAVKHFFFKCERDVEVQKSQPGRVKVYDYYNRDISSSTNYTLKTLPTSYFSQ